MAEPGTGPVRVIGITVSAGGRDWQADLGEPLDIAIGLDFEGAQPRHFGAPPATSEPLRMEDFVGDTRHGGSCNARSLTLVPHCNGTHTECADHVTDDIVGLGAIPIPAFLMAALITVVPEDAAQTSDTTLPPPAVGDRVITQAELSRGMAGISDPDVDAVVVRTMPNDMEKRFRDYSFGPVPPYFSLDAIAHLVALGVQHLLADTPSVDRIHDEGKLAGHRLFWGIPESGRRRRDARRPAATISEMVFVPDAVSDGLYLLNLQLPRFLTDAAPSRPVLYRLTPA